MLSAGKVAEHFSDLIRGKDHREMFRPFCPGDITDVTEFTLEDLVVEEGKGIESLVLGGCRDLENLRQMGEKQMHFWRSHFQRMCRVVKEDEPFDPVRICFGSSGA